MKERRFDFIRSTLKQLLNFFFNRYKRLQPTPLEVGIALMVIMFPMGVWLNQKADSTSQYLADYASGLFMLGLGLTLAYLYIDRFNERSQRQQYREVNGAMVEAVYNAVNGIVIYSFGMLLRVPEEKLEEAAGEQVNDLILDYIKFFNKYYATNRLTGLEHFRDIFDAGLNQKLQDIRHKQHIDASYMVFTEKQMQEVVQDLQTSIDRMNMGMSRLASARLKTRVIEDLLVLETQVTGFFDAFVSDTTSFTDEILAAKKSVTSYNMWCTLKLLFDDAFKFVLVLDGLLEGTAYRERQRRGDHGHLTTTASERKME